MQLLAWTDDFRGYFHQYLALPLRQRPSWQPLIGYDDRAAPEVRQPLRRLVEYYNNPPVASEETEKVRRQLKNWLRRMNGTLITDLSAALSAGP